jgi:hypothetical protein
VTQPAQTTEASLGILDDDETSGVEVRHSYIRPKDSTSGPGPCPGAETVPAFLVRQGDDGFVLPRLLVWTTLGMMAYGSIEAGASTYHYLRDARVRPLAAAHIRAEVHALVAEVARRQPSAHAGHAGYAAETTLSAATEDAHAPALAFVPYTHVSQIKANATLYECRLFSMFACEPVGRVVELLPGEVELPPAEVTALTSARPARGQYAVMQLTDPRAAEAESLRVRDPLDSLRLVESSKAPALEGEARAETLL